MSSLVFFPTHKELLTGHFVGQGLPCRSEGLGKEGGHRRGCRRSKTDSVWEALLNHGKMDGVASG